MYSSEYLVWAYRFSGVGSDARWWGRGNLTHESVTFDQISRFALGQALAASAEPLRPAQRGAFRSEDSPIPTISRDGIYTPTSSINSQYHTHTKFRSQPLFGTEV